MVSSTFRIAFMDLLLNFLHFHCRQEKQNWRMGWNLNWVFRHIQGFMDIFRHNQTLLQVSTHSSLRDPTSPVG